jgi:5-deoxy-glucuronate isomerase
MNEHLLPLAPHEEVGVRVTPELAGWSHLSFETRRLPAGAVYQGKGGDVEVAVVLLRGDAELACGPIRRAVHGRRSVFSGLPYALYVPPGEAFSISASSDVEFALGMAPARGTLPPKLITPEDVKVEIRGGHNAERQISHILDPGDAEQLLCVEVYTPSGNWSSYPPHRHDEHVPGVEVMLDEVYHFRIDPPEGWALQRL